MCRGIRRSLLAWAIRGYVRENILNKDLKKTIYLPAASLSAAGKFWKEVTSSILTFELRYGNFLRKWNFSRLKGIQTREKRPKMHLKCPQNVDGRNMAKTAPRQAMQNPQRNKRWPTAQIYLKNKKNNPDSNETTERVSYLSSHTYC